MRCKSDLLLKRLIPLSDTLRAVTMRPAVNTCEKLLEKIVISQLFGSFNRNVTIYERDRMYVVCRQIARDVSKNNRISY